jgi:hypothetical protein
MLFTFGGATAVRRIRVETSNYFSGIRVDSTGSVWAPLPQAAVRAFIVGDSFGEGTGATSMWKSYGAYLCGFFGWEMWDDSDGGTGFINTDSGLRPTYIDRTLPPVNAWIVDTRGVTGAGTFTLTQGSITTASVATNASATTLQSASDAAFGTGAFTVYAHPYYGQVLIGNGTNASVTTPMTIMPSGVKGKIGVQQYLGDIAPFVPTDETGSPTSFIIFVEGSGNDDSYGQGAVQTAAQKLYSGLIAKFPTAVVIASGRWMNDGPESDVARATNLGLQAAASSLTQYSGVTPFVNLFDSSTGVGYLNGYTNIGDPSGAPGINTDYYVYYDGTHPSWTGGHYYLASVMANILRSLFPASK